MTARLFSQRIYADRNLNFMSSVDIAVRCSKFEPKMEALNVTRSNNYNTNDS